MAANVKRTKTKTPNIYYNESTKKYDVKYNYKEYDPLAQKNKYRAKWVYSLNTVAEAKAALAELQAKSDVLDNKDITLEGAHQLWLIKANAQGFSPVTLKNTQGYLKMIYQYLPKETKIKDITEDVYHSMAANCRKHGYADETLHNINATFRKMINLVHKKKLIRENILASADNIRTEQKDSSTYRLISKEEFDELDGYFKEGKFVRLGVNNYPTYRFLVAVLYYTGMRIGEALALTFNDFEEFSYYKKGDEPLRLVPSAQDTEGEHLMGMRVKVTKAYNSDFKITKSPKNLKKRTIPCTGTVERLYHKERNYHLAQGGRMEDRIFSFTHGAVNQKLGTACKRLELKHEYNCHEFRHTYISNLISKGVPLPVIEKVSGDKQKTILSRYSHMFEADEVMVLTALGKL